MNANEDEQRRKRLRELQKMREQVTRQRGAGVGTSSPDNNPQPRGDGQRGAKLRELLQRRQAANAGNAQQPAGGRLLQVLAGRARGGAGGMAARPDGKAANPGDRGMLLRRIMQARQNRDGGEPAQYEQQLSELQNRVDQLTAEVERLRADKAGQETDSKKTPAHGKNANAPARKPELIKT